MSHVPQPQSIRLATTFRDAAAWKRYGLALCVVCTSMLITFGLRGLIEPDRFRVTYALFYAAVLASAWYAGRGPGLLAIALSALVANFFFFPPMGPSFSFDGLLQAGVFSSVSLFVVYLTERSKRAEEATRGSEEALRDSQARLAGIVESAMDAIITVGDDQRVLLFNHAAEQMFRCPAREAIGQPLERFIPERYRAPHSEHVRQFGRTGVTTRVMAGARAVYGLRADGSEFPVEASISQMEAGGQRLYTVIMRDITERLRAEEERERLLESEQAARHQVEHASRVKDEFLATLSHELRTPLTPIIGWTNMLQGGRLKEHDSAQALNVIDRNAQSLVHLINDLLDMSSILSGKMSVERAPVELNSVVRQAVETVRPLADRRRIRLEFSPCDGDRPFVVYGDRTRLAQVFWNLLNNAIKFSGNDTSVRVRCISDGDSGCVEVSDEGQGIDPEFLPHVFERFRQADSSTTRSHGGLGIGLALVKSFVESHGGTATARSDGPNTGSQFTVKLPLVSTGHLSSNGDGAAPPEPARTGDSRRVLVIEDAPDTLDLLRVIFEARGYFVTACASAEEAIEAARAARFDLVVSDVGLPQVDGYELMRALRRLPGTSRVPAVALTGYAAPKDVEQTLAAGFDAHVPKPVDPAVLTATVERVAREKNRNDAETPTSRPPEAAP